MSSKTAAEGGSKRVVSLQSFFIFDRSIATEDEAASQAEIGEKILFFHPADLTVDQQLQRISLCEGVVDFSRKFSPDKACETLRLAKAHYTFFECEPNTFVVMVVSMTNSDGEPGDATPKDPKQASEDEIDACSLQAIVKDAYGMYTMFNGTFNHTITSGKYAPADCMDQIKVVRKHIRKALLWQEMAERGDLNPDEAQQKKIDTRDEAKKRLEYLMEVSPANRIRRKLRAFLPAYLAIVDFQHLHLFYDMDGFHFFPVDRATYLSIQYFVNMLQTRFKHYTAATAFLFDGHLVWSNFDAQQMRLVYKFLRVREQEAAQRARAARAAAKRLEANKPSSPTTKQPADAPAPPGSPRVKVDLGADTVWSVDDSAIRKQLAAASRATSSGGAAAPAKRAHQLAAAATTGYMTKGRYLVSFVDQRHQNMGKAGHEASAQLVAVPEIFIPNMAEVGVDTPNEQTKEPEAGAEEGEEGGDGTDDAQRLLIYHQDRITLVMLIKKIIVKPAATDTKEDAKTASATDKAEEQEEEEDPDAVAKNMMSHWYLSSVISTATGWLPFYGRSSQKKRYWRNADLKSW